MDAEHDNMYSFLGAVQRGDDAAALSLLDQGRVTIHSVLSIESDGVKDTIHALYAAIIFGREKVASALRILGADIDAPRFIRKGEARTPVGVAIEEGSVSALALCHRLGAKMSLVCTPGKVPEVATTVAVAIMHSQSACLAYLLDYVHVVRPVELDQRERQYLSWCAISGSRAKAVFEVLKTRGFNFQVLAQEKVLSQTAEPSQVTCADRMLSFAQKSGDSAFLRYVVKDLGVASTVGGLDFSNANLNEMLRLAEIGDSMENRGGSVEVPLSKYECAACEVVGATMLCTGCRVVRYCSKDCSKKHWKTGGHKKECKDLQRDTPPVSLSGSAGPSQP